MDFARKSVLFLFLFMFTNLIASEVYYDDSNNESITSEERQRRFLYQKFVVEAHGLGKSVKSKIIKYLGTAGAAAVSSVGVVGLSMIVDCINNACDKCNSNIVNFLIKTAIAGVGCTAPVITYYCLEKFVEDKTAYQIGIYRVLNEIIPNWEEYEDRMPVKLRGYFQELYEKYRSEVSKTKFFREITPEVIEKVKPFFK